MFGAILGDIIGSRFEWSNDKTKDFELFTDESEYTDDSIMTMAVANALYNCNGFYKDLGRKVTESMRSFGRKNLDAGYGEMFYRWLLSENPKPYNSFGNGAAMRISPVGFISNSIEQCRKLSHEVASVTHNHPEGLKGAETIAICIFLARHGYSKKKIKEYTEENYYKLDFTLDSIRPFYKEDLSCINTVPEAIESFLESESFEDAIRNAVSIGGDSDTIAAMTGGIAEAFYGINEELIEEMRTFCNHDFLSYVEALEVLYCNYDSSRILEETRILLEQKNYTH